MEGKQSQLLVVGLRLEFDNILMEKRRVLKRKPMLNEKEEEGLKNLEDFIAKSLEEMNKKKIVDNFKDLELQGDINNQGICKIKNKLD